MHYRVDVEIMKPENISTLQIKHSQQLLHVHVGGLIQAWQVYVDERPTTCKMQVGKSLVIG
mgnify:CR=1 FL=1